MASRSCAKTWRAGGAADRNASIPVALTTNGVLLTAVRPALAQAGLTRLTVSLDALDPDVFAAVTDADYGVDDVLAGIDAAVARASRSSKSTAWCGAA